MDDSLQNRETGLDLQEIFAAVRRHIDSNRWNRVLILPPDITRSHSGAGALTALYYTELVRRGCSVRVMPALGTHCRMSEAELTEMFGRGIPSDAYLVHDFQNGIAPVGSIPGDYLHEISQGLFSRDVQVDINRELLGGSYDAILSIGQVVPHEIAGMAGYTKNLVVGVGGGEMINVSHFLGVFWGLEQILGRDKTPVRLLFDYAQEHLLSALPVTFIQTVMRRAGGEDRYMGMFIGRDRSVFEAAVALSREVNFNYLDRPIRRCVVWMDPHSYHSTWVSNKAIYRTQLAVEQGGEIVIIAPGVRMFGENEVADRIIRRFGYLDRGTALAMCETEPILKENLSIAGHLIHGRPEGIRVTYCTDLLGRREVEHANLGYQTVGEALYQYPCQSWRDGWHTLPDGEEIYFIANPALGMWRYGELSD